MDEMYQKFKQFLTDFRVRRADSELTPDDFGEDKYEYISPHLEKLFPTLSLTEALRIRDYFNELFIFHLTGKIAQARLSSQSSVSIQDENDEQASHSKESKTQPHSADTPGLSSSQPNLQEYTPLEASAPSQRRKTVPIMQSTPLSVPITTEGGTSEQDKMDRQQEDDFIADIISQINLSPILKTSTAPRLPQMHKVPPNQPSTSSLVHDELAAQIPHPSGFTGKPKQKRATTARLPVAEPFVRQAKKKKKKIDFEKLCCLPRKQRTEKQIKEVEQSFLYFPLMPGKNRNMIQRIIKNDVIPEGERGHIPMERIVNLSNIIRAYASQRQSSIEQPGQGSFLAMSRSASTPQAILRTSNLQPFTPLRGDISSQSPGMETDYITSFPRRSLLRQQPLLTIPERDSTIPIPLSPQHEENPQSSSLNIPPLDIGVDQASMSHLPVAIAEDIEMVNEPQSVHGPQLEQNPQSSSLIISPLDIGEGQASVSHLPVAIAEDIEMINEAQTVKVVASTLNVVDVPTDIADMVEAIHREDEPQLSWFEILRPRVDIIYPRVDGEKKKKKKRKRRLEPDIQPRRVFDLPEIPMSPTPSNTQHFPQPCNDTTHEIVQLSERHSSEQMEQEFTGYFKLIKEAGGDPKYKTWECFDPYLFNEDDNFEMATHIFKRIIKEDYVAMDTLYEEGTTRLQAAKGFKLILEFCAMGLIEIDSANNRIKGLKFKPVEDEDFEDAVGEDNESSNL